MPDANSIEDQEKNEYLGELTRLIFLDPDLLNASNIRNNKINKAPYWKTASNFRAIILYMLDSWAAVVAGSLIAYTHITNDSKIGINIRDLFQSFESSLIFLII